MESPRWHLTAEDVASAVRHTVVPLVVGGVVEAARTLDAGTMDAKTLIATFAIAVLSGLGRLLERWAANTRQK